MDFDIKSQFTALIPAEPHSATQEGRGRKQWSGQRRKYRWAPKTALPLIPGLPKHIDPEALTVEQMEALAMRVRIEEITQKLVSSNLEMGLEERGRSPSPEPIYDPVSGHRTNTRDLRIREKLSIERQYLVQDAQKICPVFRPPPDYRPISLKKYRKIAIPLDKYPDYNFIGLIIGPRGKTHRELEQETGTKIAIRGKGSSRGVVGLRKDGRPQEGDDEPLHVFVTADTEKQLQMAVRKIAKLLVPIEEDKNDHKRKQVDYERGDSLFEDAELCLIVAANKRLHLLQLRELALINGTVKLELRDKTWLAPDQEERDWKPAAVKCTHCGETSHPSLDCPFKGTEIEAEYQKQKKKIDEEYLSFLDEVGVGPAPPPEPKKALADYEDFMKDLEL